MIGLREERNGMFMQGISDILLEDRSPVVPEGLAGRKKPWMPKRANDAEDQHGVLIGQIVPQKQSSDCPIAA